MSDGNELDMARRTLVYQAAKSTSFFTPMAIWTAPSIFASSLALAGPAGGTTGAPELSSAKSTTLSFCSAVSRLLRYAKSSFPDSKTVELEDRARTAKGPGADSIDASTMVKTLG